GRAWRSRSWSISGSGAAWVGGRTARFRDRTPIDVLERGHDRTDRGQRQPLASDDGQDLRAHLALVPGRCDGQVPGLARPVRDGHLLDAVDGREQPTGALDVGGVTEIQTD